MGSYLSVEVNEDSELRRQLFEKRVSETLELLETEILRTMPPQTQKIEGIIDEFYAMLKETSLETERVSSRMLLAYLSEACVIALKNGDDASNEYFKNKFNSLLPGPLGKKREIIA